MTGRAPASPARADDLRAEINVTPLVDVCLVLLIIFMVVTPLIREGTDVALPEAARPTALPERDREVVVSIRADRSVWVGGEPLPLDALAAALARHGVNGDSGAVVVRADRSLPFGEVRTVIKTLNNAGVRRASLATRRATDGAGAAEGAP